MFFLGIDVAKLKLDACLYSQGINGKKKHKTFSNNPEGFAKLLQWLMQNQCTTDKTHIVMEATSVYHENAAVVLHRAGCVVCIANPAKVRHFAQGLSIISKTDKADSEVLARFAALANPKPWQPPSEQAQHLSALLTRRDALVVDLQREQNRLEKAQATLTPQSVSDSIQASITFIQNAIYAIDQDVQAQIDQDPHMKHHKKLLLSIPAVGERTGTMMLSLMQTHHFDRADQMAAYLGLVPIQHQSGSSINGRSRLSKAGSSKIRKGLYMAAVVGIRYNPHIKALYDRLVLKGKSKMSALCAAMRKLVHLCFGVVKTQTPYQATY